MNRIKKITLFLLVFTLVFASAFFLVACNEQQEDEGDITRDLYVYAIAFEDAGATEEESSAKVQADADSSADKTAIVSGFACIYSFAVSNRSFNALLGFVPFTWHPRTTI